MQIKEEKTERADFAATGQNIISHSPPPHKKKYISRFAGISPQSSGFALLLKMFNILS